MEDLAKIYLTPSSDTLIIYAWVDPCIAPLVQALNNGGMRTTSSCCGHGQRPGTITLEGGLELLVADYDTARLIDPMFPDIHGNKISEAVRCPNSDGNSCEQYRLKGQYCQDCPLPAVANAVLELQRALTSLSDGTDPQLLEIRVTPDMWHTLRQLPEPYVSANHGIDGDKLTLCGIPVHAGRSQ